MQIFATGLRFPEGPAVLPDGSIAFVEIARGTVSRATLDGAVSVLATPGGGPNGLALGPDGSLFVCNNGGFEWLEADGLLRPVGTPADYSGGRIERVDIASGAVQVLYAECEGQALSGPNDIVFDVAGGFYFTDLGKIRKQGRDHGGVFYAKADGSEIRRIAYPVLSANGIGLSPDGQVLYVAETETSRLWAFDIVAPGQVAKHGYPSPHGGRLVCGLPGFQRFDSLAVEAGGAVCVATLVTGCITVISPDGSVVEQVDTPDSYTTNLCFIGSALDQAVVTLSGQGALGLVDWARPGLRLRNQNP